MRLSVAFGAACVGLGLVFPSLADLPAHPDHPIELPDAKPVELSKVPKPVIAAAREELVTKPTTALIGTDGGETVYVLGGRNRARKDLVVEVAPDGKVLKPVSIWDADDD